MEMAVLLRIYLCVCVLVAVTALLWPQQEKWNIDQNIDDDDDDVILFGDKYCSRCGREHSILCSIEPL